MKKKITYITGNIQKYEAACMTFVNTPYLIEQLAIETPEIQSHSVKEVALFSAVWACQQLSRPVMVTDAGLEIEALNGFPGPFIKYVNGWFTEKDYVNLMQGHTNRKARLVDCLAFCEPGNDPIAFMGYYEGTISDKVFEGGLTPMDKVFIPKGFDRPISQMNPQQLTAYWSKGMILSQFAMYLANGE